MKPVKAIIYNVGQEPQVVTMEMSLEAMKTIVVWPSSATKKAIGWGSLSIGPSTSTVSRSSATSSSPGLMTKGNAPT